MKAGISEPNYSKIYDQIRITFSENVDNGLGNGELHFGDIPDSGETLAFDRPKIIGQPVM